MNEIKVNDPNDFSVYPNHRVCAIIDTDMDARSALDALLRAKVHEDHIHIFYGWKGIETLDPEGGEHGLFARLATALRTYGDIENETMKHYEDAMKNGGVVFEITAEADEEN